MLAEGAVGPEFSLPRLGGDGRKVSLAELAHGGAVVVAFFKISCPVCQFSFPFLERLSQGSLPIVAISQDDAEGTAEFHEELGITLPTLLEQRGYAVSNSFGITTVPSFFLIEPDGRISISETGFSKAMFESVGQRAGVTPFRPDERIPTFRPG